MYKKSIYQWDIKIHPISLDNKSKKFFFRLRVSKGTKKYYKIEQNHKL
mgnify:CR=1 FL=1